MVAVKVLDMVSVEPSQDLDHTTAELPLVSVDWMGSVYFRQRRETTVDLQESLADCEERLSGDHQSVCWRVTGFLES